jgi:RNA polymerase sigma factor (TIGR02999 family)
MAEVTQILASIAAGNHRASQDLFLLIYDELRCLAAAKMRHEKPGHTLQATALVHEAFVKLMGEAGFQNFSDRRHFFGAAAEAMRRILIDAARRKQTEKHGGDWERIEFDDGNLISNRTDDRLVALSEAMDSFAEQAPEKAQLVKLRIFGGLSLDEAAALLEISPSTADRWWRYARAWLKNCIDEESEKKFD